MALVFALVAVTLGGLATVEALLVTNITPIQGPITGGQKIKIDGEFELPSPINVAQISAGVQHTCALDFDGQAYCWGVNWSGQLGNDSYDDSPVPAAVDTTGVLDGKTLVQISVGNYHTCALDSTGQAYCWGVNWSGQLGNDSYDDSPVPVTIDTSDVLDGKTLTQISAGEYHTCALDSDGQVYCWGRNWEGQLGNNSTGASSVPIAVDTTGVLDGKTLTQVSAGRDYTCVLDSDGQAYCWGNVLYGGELVSRVPYAVDTSGVLDGKTLTQIATGHDHACVLDSDGLAYCWGSNDSGQLGDNTGAGSLVPVAVDTSGVLNGKTLAQISAGTSHTCAIDSNGQTYCWGSNDSGQFGNGFFASEYNPAPVDTSSGLGGKTLIQISAGNYHACALDSDNQAYCWGRGDYGQLGISSYSSATFINAVHGSLDGTGSALPGGGTVKYTVTFDPSGSPVPCTNVKVAADGKSLTCIISAHSAGLVDIAISSGASTQILAGAYEYTNSTLSPNPNPNTNSGSTPTITAPNTGLNITKIGGLLITGLLTVSIAVVLVRRLFKMR